MKKYLMTGVAALAICAAFTSCSKSGDELYNPEAVSQMSKEKITETYNARFLAYVGGSIAPDQDWGFGTATRAFTRANGVGEVIKPDNGKDGIFEFTNDERNATGWRSPEGVAKYVAPITDAEREFVQAWFNDPAHAGLSDEGKEFNKRENVLLQQGEMRNIYTFNKNYYIRARRGDTFRRIAEDVDISYRKLAKYNERDKHDVLEEGEIVWLGKKAKKAPKAFKNRPHRVQPGESMYIISQRYGIRLKYLYKMNGLTPDYVIRPGDLLRVR